MNKVDVVNDIMRDVRRAVRDLEGCVSNIEDAVDNLRDFTIVDVIEQLDEVLMAEVLVAGLPLIEAKYGLSSKEASLVRSHIHTLTKK